MATRRKNRLPKGVEPVKTADQYRAEAITVLARAFQALDPQRMGSAENPLSPGYLTAELFVDSIAAHSVELARILARQRKGRS